MKIKPAFTATLISLAIIILIFSCTKDPVSVVSFRTPGIYNGTYQTIIDWHSGQELAALDTVVFDFRGNGTFTMDIVHPEQDSIRHCSVDSGTFIFYGDSLKLTVITQNSDQQICVYDRKPEGSFTYDVQSGYLVFQILNPDLFKKIELIGY